MEIDPFSQKCKAPRSEYLVDFGPLAGESIPEDDCTLIVTAGQEILVIAAPADTATTNKVGITRTLHRVAFLITALFAIYDK